MPGQLDKALASMGIYVFSTDVMYELLFEDAVKKKPAMVVLTVIFIPAMILTFALFAYPFQDENRKEAAYWRDVGTIEAYFQTSMDLIQLIPF